MSLKRVTTKSTPKRKAIKGVLHSINSNFGKGNLGKIDWRNRTVERIVPITQSVRSKVRKYRFRIEGNKVTLINHTRVWKNQK